MKLFLDTNIFVEFVGRRDQFESVSRIIDAILEDEHIAFISTGCVYVSVGTSLLYMNCESVKGGGDLSMFPPR